jgi:hypothetical protein
MNNSSEQFDVLSNALRVLPEEIFRLNYFMKEVKDPEEGISNIEIACVNVFNQLYGMMCALKDEGHMESIYDHQAITAILCMRHVLQHKAGRIKNNLRDTFKKELKEKSALVNHGASGKNALVTPFYISTAWLQDGVQNSNNAKRFPLIKSYLSLDRIEADLLKLHIPLEHSYIGVMPLITEAVRQICVKYGSFFEPTGFDSKVYYEHFISVYRIDTNIYTIVAK